MLRAGDLKSLHIYAERATQQQLQGVARDFRNHSGRQSDDRLGQQPLQVAARVLNLIEGPFDPLAHAIEPAVE